MRSSSLSFAPGTGTTQATTFSIQYGSCSPTTATSATPGCAAIASSTSWLETFSPPLLIMSFLRSRKYSHPCSSTRATSPVWCQPPRNSASFAAGSSKYPGENTRPAQNNLSWLAGFHVVHLLIHDAQLERDMLHADGVRRRQHFSQLGRWRGRSQRRGFGLPPAVDPFRLRRNSAPALEDRSRKILKYEQPLQAGKVHGFDQRHADQANPDCRWQRKRIHFLHGDGMNDLLRLGQRNDYALTARRKAAKRHHQPGHVKHGQRQQILDGSIAAIVGVTGHQVRIKIQVRQHHALRLRRGSAGKDDQVRRLALHQLLNRRGV